MKLTCKKTFRNIPFAHRQHRHDGHCARIHGHNWSITLTFGCIETDTNGFVVDFGKLQYIRDWIDTHLDHACLFNDTDPSKDALIESAPGAWKPYVLPDCSSEGLARHLYRIFNPMVQSETKYRAFIVAVEIEEDEHNSARYHVGFPESEKSE